MWKFYRLAEYMWVPSYPPPPSQQRRSLRWPEGGEGILRPSTAESAFSYSTAKDDDGGTVMGLRELLATTPSLSSNCILPPSESTW